MSRKTIAKCFGCECTLDIPTCGGRVQACNKEECREKLESKNWPYVPEGSRQCDWPGCSNSVAEGYYYPITKRFACSSQCYNRLADNQYLRKCAHCGVESRGNYRGENAFCSKAHMAEFMAERSSERVGTFRPLLDRYLSFAKEEYRGNGLISRKVAVVCFLEFLQEHGITSISEESVTPRTISAFVAWGKEVNRPTRRYTSAISTFMDWLANEGERTSNPVNRFHRYREPKRLPRPYSEEEVKLIWKYLEERGSTQAKLAAAIAEESGCRIGEIANIRLSDIERFRIFVRLPNKTMCERFAPYYLKTEKYLEIWLRERDRTAAHDHLLHNRFGHPFQSDSLHYELARAICKTVRDRKINEEGFDKWSCHRLRHTMATRLVRHGADAATVMAIGGWVTAQAMTGYAEVEDEVAERGYRESMEKLTQPVSPPTEERSSFAKYRKSSPAD